MAEFGSIGKYVAPEKVEKDNPFVEPLTPIIAEGVDTLFDITFDADKYTAEKLQVQNAARRLGASVRVHESDYEDGSGRKKVKTTFRVRPLRKSRSADEAETDADEGTDSVAE